MNSGSTPLGASTSLLSKARFSMLEKPNPRALIVGCGYVGSALALQLLGQGWQVDAITRASFPPPACQHLALDVSKPFKLARGYDRVFYLLSAERYELRAYEQAYCLGLEHTLSALKEHSSHARILYASSTSVFAENTGAWVTEESPLSADSSPSQALIAGEKLLAASGFQATIVRLAGIYGPSRDRLLRLVRQREAKLSRESVVSNRIFLDDAAAILLFLSTLKQPQPLYIACDSAPTELNKLILWLHKQLGISQPLGWQEAKSPRPHISNKYCANTLLRSEGYIFKYPSYKEGFLALLAKA